MAVFQWSPSNLTEVERICKAESQKIPQIRCAKLVVSYPKRIKAVIAAKMPSNKYGVKCLNAYVHCVHFVIIASVD